MTDRELKNALLIQETRGYMREVTTPHDPFNPTPFAAIECRRVVRDGSAIIECCWIGEVAAPVPIGWEVLRQLGLKRAPDLLNCFPWPLGLICSDPEHECSWYIRKPSHGPV